MITLLDLSGNVISNGLGLGQGKNELLELTAMYNKQNRSIELYDARKGNLVKVIQSSNNLESEELFSNLRLYDDGFRISENKIVVLPVNSKTSVKLLDQNLNCLDSLSCFPNKPEGMTDEIHQLACTGMNAISPKDSTFIRAYSYNGGLAFFRINNDSLKLVKMVNTDSMDYKPLSDKANVPVPTKTSKTGYAYVASTDDYFYASYSDQLMEENPSGLANEIHVFDHSGNMICKFILEDSIQCFDVDPNAKYLYGVKENEDNTQIIRYPIPSK